MRDAMGNACSPRAWGWSVLVKLSLEVEFEIPVTGYEIPELK
jgi:hypothetical protein